MVVQLSFARLSGLGRNTHLFEIKKAMHGVYTSLFCVYNLGDAEFYHHLSAFVVKPAAFSNA